MTNSLFLALVLIFLSFSSFTQSQNKTRLGLGLIDLDSDGLSSFGQQVINVINQDRTILRNYQLYQNNPQRENDSSVFSINKGALNSIRAGGFGLVGPSNSTLAEIVAITAGDFNETNISYYAGSSDLSDKEIYPLFFRTNPSEVHQGTAIADLVTYYGWNDIVVMSENSDYGLDLTESFIDRARINNINILQVYFYSVTLTRIEVGLLEVRDLGVRIIVVLTAENTFRDILRAASKLNMIGKPYVYVGSTTTMESLTQGPDGRVDSDYKSNALGVLALGDRAIPNYNTPFLKRFDNVQNLSLRFQYLATAIYSYAYALDQVLDKQNLKPEDVTGIELASALRKIRFRDPVWPSDPPVQFDEAGDKLNPVFSIFNFQSSGRVLVGSWVDGKVTIDEPITWPKGLSKIPDSSPHLLVEYFSCPEGERFNDTRGLVRIQSVDGDPENIESDFECDGIVDCNNHSDENFSCDPSLPIGYIVLSVLAVLGIVYLLFCLLIILRYRKRGRIRAVGVVFLLLSTTACLIGICSIFTFFGKPSSPLCVFRVWIITLASALLIGSLSARQYRVWKVFSNKSINPVVFTEVKLTVFTVVLMIPDIILCTCWTAFDTIEARVEDDHLQCSSDYFLVFLILILVWKAIVSGFSSLLAFLSRNFPGAYSDAKLIGFAVRSLLIQILI
eukprot:TRINITY_DN829_c0_g1_i1.p1 TRINITY_DN829_c0_g1~~TRINITY_DN829_c0_g1_i1.p1  ORF type:complete len:693 (-),score=108.49 TRINITY_DN829_c0_g1_i1:612-2636(-)